MTTAPIATRAAICIAAGVLGLATVACGSQVGSTRSRDATVVAAYPYNDRLLGPSDDEAMYLIFLPLLRYDQHGNLEGRLARIHAVTVHDDSMVTVRSGAAEHYQRQVLHYPRQLLQELDPEETYDWRFWLEPVGNGLLT